MRRVNSPSAPEAAAQQELPDASANAPPNRNRLNAGEGDASFVQRDATNAGPSRKRNRLNAGEGDASFVQRDATNAGPSRKRQNVRAQ